MKYTLIQTYPGYETLGKIEDSENGYTTGWQGANFYDAHPRYWLKVEEIQEVDFNEPCLSLNEISTVLNSNSPLFEKIIELAKLKL